VKSRRVPGILVIYWHAPPYAATVLEHARSFRRHSAFPVHEVNASYGYPQALDRLEYSAVVLHYSLFGTLPYALDEAFLAWLDAASASYKVGFFQDEYRFCEERFAFVDRFELDSVFTLIEPRFWDETYRAHTNVPHLVHTLPGYVSVELRRAARRYARPQRERKVDVGYRARPVPYSIGPAGRDKTRIAEGFLRHTAGSGLNVDVTSARDERLYGRAWYRFLGNCRAVLGVEGGASTLDVDGALQAEHRRLDELEPELTFDQFWKSAERLVEHRLPYLMVTPRHFEAAALGCLQILFRGEYSGVLEAGRHYVPLEKDFSNIDTVIAALRDEPRRLDVIRRAYDELVLSGDYDYERMVEQLDALLSEEGVLPCLAQGARGHSLPKLRRSQVRGLVWQRARRGARAPRLAAARLPGVNRLRTLLHSTRRVLR